MRKIILFSFIIFLIIVLSSYKYGNGEIAELPSPGLETNIGSYSITFKDVEGKEKMSPEEYRENLKRNNEEHKKKLVSMGIFVKSYDVDSPVLYASMSYVQSDEVKKIPEVLTIRNIAKNPFTGEYIYS